PAIAACIIIAIIKGKDGLKELRDNLIKWRVGISWYIIAIGLPIIVSIFSYLLYILLNGSPDFSLVPLWFVYFPLLSLYLIGEEIGWRGFATPQLLKKYNPLVVGLLMGVMWALWHLPVFIIPEHPQSEVPFEWYLVLAISTTIIITWLYLKTEGSILLAMILHGAIDATFFIFPMAFSAFHPIVFFCVGYSAAATIIVFCYSLSQFILPIKPINNTKFHRTDSLDFDETD
ncbi:MAG: lysostaphin resistance A-like protein, partial [Candidatus Hodarchaeota archaeon]